MTEEIEAHIPFSDLNRLSFACPCGTEITIDINSQKNREHLWEKRTIRCPTCQGTFDQELGFALDRLVSWYDRIEKTQLKVSFRVTKPLISANS